MRRLAVIGLIPGMLISSTSVAAQGGAPVQAGKILDSAYRGGEQIVRAVAAHSGQAAAPEPTRRRSMARTWGGAVLMGLGLTTVVKFGGERCVRDSGPNYYFEECSFNSDSAANSAGTLMFAVGLLLATIWSDVPMESLDFELAPGRVRVGKTIGF